MPHQFRSSVCPSVRSCHTFSVIAWMLWFLPCDAMRCTVFAIVILSVCLSVRPSVCLPVTLVDCVHMVRPIRSWFLHHMVAHHSSFWGYQVHPKSRRGSPLAMALNEGGVGTNWRFSTNKPPSPKRCEIRQRLLLLTNRKSYTRFRLVPKSTTLVDPEMTLNGYDALCCITHVCFGANH